MREESDIAWHLSPEGLSGEVIDDLVRSAGISDGYRGVATAARLGEEDGGGGEASFTVIVNISGAHWATAHVKPGCFALYADSYGLPPNDHLHKFFTTGCRVSGDKIWYNARRIQALDSNYCGLFAALFALHFDKYGDNQERQRRQQRRRPVYKWETRSSRLGKNDKRCYNYLIKHWM